MKRHPCLVAIAGGSGSGKTFLADQLARLLGRGSARFSLDAFYRDRSRLTPGQRARINFDHPRAIDWKWVQRTLQNLRRGKAADIPCYDFATHCRLKKVCRISPKPVVIVEGLWPFRTVAFRRMFSVKIFIECHSRIRLQRRLSRDLATRGRTKASIRTQFRTAVEPMHSRHVAPQERWADITLRRNWGDGEVRVIASLLKRMIRSPIALPEE